jgi:hypothetical protein
MMGVSSRHEEVPGELVEWWEDLCQRGMTSRVVLVAVPRGWGRTTVLDRLAAAVSADEAPVTLTARIAGKGLPEGRGAQAAVLRECLATAAARHRVAELLGLDRLGGITQLGLGVGGLFVSGRAVGAEFLAAGVALGVAGKLWDDRPAGADGALARTARAVAEASVHVPVVVAIDDADQLDEDLAVTLIESLAARHNGHVLVVAAVDPDGSLRKALVSRARMGITEGLVQLADADPDMGYDSRLALVAELCPRLPAVVARRVARVTATFKDVFAVAAAPRLAGPGEGEDEARLLEAADAVAAVVLRGPDPSAEAVITAWAGGLLHARQAARALEVTGQPHAGEADPDLVHAGDLVRAAAADGPRLAGRVAALGLAERRAMAGVLLDEALRIAADPGCGPAEQVAAAQAAHHVRGDLASRARLPRLQRHLVTVLEALGEPAAALGVAVTAVEEYPPGGRDSDRGWLAAAVLRLGDLAQQHEEPLVAELIAEAVAGGAGLGLEARVWAAADLLRAGVQRAAALELLGQVAAALDEHAAALGPSADEWRLLLAFDAGRAGQPAIAARLLAPLLSSPEEARQGAAAKVLYACDGPQADTRLQVVVLEAELAALPVEADDDRLRVHHALAAGYAALSYYHQALAHAQAELSFRIRIQAPGHPHTLAARGDIAYYTGESGDPAGALRLSRELLPDLVRVLGSHDPDTLSARGDIAFWTARCGDLAEALDLELELLPDLVRVLGPHAPDTLTALGYIAGWTGESGHPAVALALFRELLPDLVRVLGSDDPDTLAARGSIAYLTGRCGDLAGALRLYREVLPDLERVLGPDHPVAFSARAAVAGCTGESGDPAGALALYLELLPDLVRVLGRDHPNTLVTRGNIAHWTGETRDLAEGLRLFRELLADMERVLRPGHPDIESVRRQVELLSSRAAGRR